MKTELIEYHRKQRAQNLERMEEWSRGTLPAGLDESGRQWRVAYNRSEAEFHERAVAWLESLQTIEELPIYDKVAAELDKK